MQKMPYMFYWNCRSIR